MSDSQLWFHSVVVRCPYKGVGNYAEEVEVEEKFRSIAPEVLAVFKTYAKKFVFQLERGAKEGKLHYQAFLNLQEKLRPACLAKRLQSDLEGLVLNVGASHCSTAGKQALQRYCMKSDTRVLGPWADHAIYMGQDLITNLRPWQVQLKEELLSPDAHARKIIWIYDKAGGLGKSSFAKYMGYHHDIPKLTFADARSLLYLVAKFANKPAYMFDLSRTKPASVSMSEIYQALEDVKNGHFVSSKYESEIVIMQTPNIVVFSNSLPDFKALSADKWDVREISL